MGKPHRTYTSEFKVRVVMELISGKKSLGEASREYGIKDSVFRAGGRNSWSGHHSSLRRQAERCAGRADRRVGADAWDG